MEYAYKKEPGRALGRAPEKEVARMKGYVTPFGFMGLVGRRWILFATESDYAEHLVENLAVPCRVLSPVSASPAEDRTGCRDG